VRKDQPTSTALLVESDEQVMALLEFMLAREGYQLVSCADGRQADEYVRRSGPVDIVVLELVLPYKDGFELIRQIRSAPGWHNVPVVILSARRLESDIVRGLDAGANDYVTKPYSPRELIARIKRHTETAAVLGPAGNESTAASEGVDADVTEESVA